MKGCCWSQYNNTTIHIQKLLMEHSNHISFQLNMYDIAKTEFAAKTKCIQNDNPDIL
jgi:hypothetical protein